MLSKRRPACPLLQVNNFLCWMLFSPAISHALTFHSSLEHLNHVLVTFVSGHLGYGQQQSSIFQDKLFSYLNWFFAVVVGRFFMLFFFFRCFYFSFSSSSYWLLLLLSIAGVIFSYTISFFLLPLFLTFSLTHQNIGISLVFSLILLSSPWTFSRLCLVSALFSPFLFFCRPLPKNGCQFSKALSTTECLSPNLIRPFQ